MKGVWTDFATGFVDWWVRNRLKNGDGSVGHVDAILLEVEQRFASVLQQYADSRDYQFVL